METNQASFFHSRGNHQGEALMSKSLKKGGGNQSIQVKKPYFKEVNDDFKDVTLLMKNDVHEDEETQVDEFEKFKNVIELSEVPPFEVGTKLR